ncbi:hypothetical protein UCDDA912_g08168 [Diaporthe ampelina]|uniref:Uncharacterized protein n=1 Tax=Diaporthe ampelina TaxID=1214573 RepID=A0A0G2FCI5_9PEZI|nr:hypothetical protein UCDDA912_g08168 [Diaporthe ampelina]
MANPPVFGRRLWRRQALFAIFRTAEFDWVQSNRTAKIEAKSQDLLRAFHLFARPFADGRALELIRDIVTAAVQLNERIIIEADDLWTIELEGSTGSEDDFYDNMADYDLKPVGTLTALRDNAPLNTIARRLNMDLVKQRVKRLCVVTPALRYQHVHPQGEWYGDVAHVVKPRVLVALKEITPAGTLIQASLHDELVFYSMAKSLGLIQEPLSNQ